MIDQHGISIVAVFIIKATISLGMISMREPVKEKTHP